MLKKKWVKDWLKDLGDCESKQQLKTKADRWGIGLSEQETEEAFGLLSDGKNGELSDEELKDYAGGLLIPLANNPPPDEFYEK